jgi:hypothetical protein
MLYFLEETEDIVLNQFSFVLFASFIYYSLSYYFLSKNEIKKPKFLIYMSIVILHISHMVLLKFLHYNGDYPMMWLSMLLPLMFYIIYNKYNRYNKEKEELKMKLMYKKLKEEKEAFEASIPNRKPQMPNKTEMQPDYVGLGNNQQRTMQSNVYNEMKNTVQTREVRGDMNYNPDDVRGSQMMESAVVDAFPPMQEQNQIMGFDPYGSAFGQLM